LASVMLSCSRQ